MGGFGSGRYPKSGIRSRSKRLTTELPRIRSFDMMKRSYEEGSMATTAKLDGVDIVVTPKSLELYRGGEAMKGRLVISTPMRKEACGLGGHRFTFSCPCCQKRSIFLYWDGGRLGCAKCHNLAQPTQNMSNENRWFHKRDRFLKKSRVSFDQASYHSKPKWKHAKKFRRDMHVFEEMDRLASIIFMNRFTYPLALQQIRSESRNNKPAKTHFRWA